MSKLFCMKLSMPCMRAPEEHNGLPHRVQLTCLYLGRVVGGLLALARCSGG